MLWTEYGVCRILTTYCMKAMKTLLKCEIRGENHFQKSERNKEMIHECVSAVVLEEDHGMCAQGLLIFP